MFYSQQEMMRCRRRGVIVPAAALLLIALVGVLAIAIDGGMLLSNKRHVQAAADAAALAAAVELFTNSPKGTDTSGNAAITNLPPPTTVTPTTWAGQLHGQHSAPIRSPQRGQRLCRSDHHHAAAAVFQHHFRVDQAARQRPRRSPGSQNPRNNGIIILDPSGSNDLNATASGNVTVIGGNIIVDSSDSRGATISNTGNIKADNLYFSGTPGYGTSNTGKFIATNGKIYSNQTPTPDPLKDLPPPAEPQVGYNNVNISGLPTKTIFQGGSVPGWPDPNNANGWILPAGTYNNGIHISDNNSSHTYTLQSGLFFFKGGGLNLSGSAAINCESTGVCLYFHNGGAISITAGGPVTLSPLQSGTYANVTVYEDRSNTSQNSITGQTGGSLNVTGTFYAAAAKVTVTGSGSDYTIGSQYIVYQLSVTGSGNFNVDYSALAVPNNRNLYLVE